MFLSNQIDSPLKLIDFGSSNEFIEKNQGKVKKIKRMKSFIGSEIFTSPEIFEGNYDEKCDIWSLGKYLFFKF